MVEGPAADVDDLATEVQGRGPLSLSSSRKRWRLSWSDAAGTHASPLEGRVLVGSSQLTPVRVADRAVSRVHAELEVKDDGVWLRDLDSRNGSWIEGILCRQARIPDGARITLGNTMLTLAPEADPATVPLWPDQSFGAMVARTEIMREMFMRLHQYADSDAPVLIQGETGTGKELVAEAIHQASPRAEGPLVIVDCGALPENLLESELFGHARGAFTGAVGAREGAFEAADGGTVFLDEIGELPLGMQPKLLRVLETKTVRRLGESDYRRIDLRFVCATHRDLSSLVAAGGFREDLFFRLAVLPVFVPPLRARPDDIPLLLAHFLAARAPSTRVPVELLRDLVQHPWHGNVRELRSFSERAATVGPEAAWAMTRGLAPSPSPAPVLGATAPHSAKGALPPVDTAVPFKDLREAWASYLEREYIGQLLAKHGRNLAAIAAEAGLDRSYVRRLVLKHGI